MFAFLASHFSRKEIILDLIFLLALVVAWFRPRLGSRIFDPAEKLAARVAARLRLAIVLIAVIAVLVRLSLLELLPVPIPRVHDEFSYLLAADTFAHGRVTNPPHPMWIFFETFHVNQQPTYMSKYPPAQGAVLALGQALGHPWIGVLLGVAAMCAATLWMLQGWLPAPWALLGAALVLLRLGIFTYWVNSYWGGAVAAIGGALVAGALPRILRFQRWRDAVFLTVGAAILANSRPLEGLVFCVPVALVLLVWLFSKRSPPLRLNFSRVVLPICAVAVLCASAMAYYNWRGTGSAFLFPYMVNEKAYSSTPTLFWQAARPPLHYRNPQFEAYYNGWAREYWSKNRLDSAAHVLKHVSLVFLKIIYFFLWPELAFAFVALPWIFRDRRIRVLVVQASICFVGFLLVPWTEAHYAAPLVPVLFLLAVQGIRHWRAWSFAGRPIGIGFSRVIVLAAIFFAPFHHRSGTFEPETGQRPKIEQRAKVLADLKAMPGEHLVIVRYSPTAPDGGEWVYNDADIDHAKVVWARDIPNVDSRPLLDYFRGRNVWLAEPDASPPRLTPYSNSR